MQHNFSAILISRKAKLSSSAEVSVGALIVGRVGMLALPWRRWLILQPGYERGFVQRGAVFVSLSSPVCSLQLLSW